jgi:hypothetical protein
MNLSYFLRAGFAALTNAKTGPTLYDLCDPLLRGNGGGDAHLRKFYKTALGNPALRPLLSRAGLPQLQDAFRLRSLRDALIAAREQPQPDWRVIAQPLAALIDEFPQSHPRPAARPASARRPSGGRIEEMIHACARHLTDAFARHGFIPTYAAFNLVGDPDLRGRDLVTALVGLNARTYKNATLLFNLARAFILANPALAALLNPPWRGIAEPMWEPVQIRHRSAYYDAFFAEALMDFLASGLAGSEQTRAARGIVEEMIAFCLTTSREQVPSPDGGAPVSVVTALVPPPHARMSRFFWQLKSDLGFGVYVPDCDTTACSFSAATQFGADDKILAQPLIDFYAGYQVGHGNTRFPPTVAINDNIDYDGAVVTWIENGSGEQPFGNDLDPTLNLDVLEVSFRNHARWGIADDPRRLKTLQGIVRFQDRLAASGAFADPRAHIYYLPELYCAYFGRCHAAFRALPAATQAAIDPDGAFPRIRDEVLAYVRDDLCAHEMNPFDAALALLALAKLEAEPETMNPALACLDQRFGEGGRRVPFKAYEWNKMKTPTRVLVGGPEVTSAFALSALVHARAALRRAGAA